MVEVLLAAYMLLALLPEQVVEVVPDGGSALPDGVSAQRALLLGAQARALCDGVSLYECAVHRHAALSQLVAQRRDTGAVVLSSVPWSDGLSAIRVLDGWGAQRPRAEGAAGAPGAPGAPGATQQTSSTSVPSEMLLRAATSAADARALRRELQLGNDMPNEGMRFVQARWLLKDLPQLVGFPPDRVPASLPRAAWRSLVAVAMPSFRGQLRRALDAELCESGGAGAGANTTAAAAAAAAAVAAAEGAAAELRAPALKRACALRRRVRDAVAEDDTAAVTALFARTRRVHGVRAAQDAVMFAFEAVVEARQRRCVDCTAGCCELAPAPGGVEEAVCRQAASPTQRLLALVAQHDESEEEAAAGVLAAAVAAAVERARGGVDGALEAWQLLAKQFPQAARLKSSGEEGSGGGGRGHATGGALAAAWQVCAFGRRAAVQRSHAAFDSWVRRLDAVGARRGAFCPAEFFHYHATLHNAKQKAAAAEQQRSHAEYAVTVLPLFIHASEDAHAVLRLFAAHEGLRDDVAVQLVQHGMAQHLLWEQKRSASVAPEETKCFSSQHATVPLCDCHSSCGTCGYSAKPTGEYDCITCASEEMTLTAVFGDGTGSCAIEQAEAAASAAAVAAAAVAALPPPAPQEGCVDGARLATRNDNFFVESKLTSPPHPRPPRAHPPSTPPNTRPPPPLTPPRSRHQRLRQHAPAAFPRQKLVRPGRRAAARALRRAAAPPRAAARERGAGLRRGRARAEHAGRKPRQPAGLRAAALDAGNGHGGARHAEPRVAPARVW